MTVITVSQVNTYIKALLDESAPLKNIFIVGEISNFKHYFQSGHMYFTLKDEKCQLKAVMFASYADKLKFKPENGMRVVCRGRISVYDKDGVYQLYAVDMQPDGIGALNLAYEQLKEKLSKEGLFDDIYKKTIPKYPKKIGVATSDMGAAIEDIKNIIKRRYPVAELVIVPTAVQGEQATSDIVKSLKLLDEIDDIDVIIVGRGGGSIEDLWAFNTEEVARTVFSCSKPVISAVGHETDYTICDFVSDLRAPTPSAAAELCVPDSKMLLTYLENLNGNMVLLLQHRLEYEYQRLDSFQNNSVLADANAYFSSYAESISELNNKMINSFSSKINTNSLILSSYADKLNALSPLAVIGRGYGIIKKNNTLIKTADDLAKGDNIEITLNGGKVNCTVNEVKNG